LLNTKEKRLHLRQPFLFSLGPLTWQVNSKAMNPSLENYILSIGENSKSFLRTFAELSTDQLNWKPDTRSWSIAQIIEHLILANESYYPAFEKIKAGRNTVPWVGKISFIPKAIGNMIAQSLKPETKRKTKTFKVWGPQSSFISDVLTRFERHHLTLIQELRLLEPYLKKGVIISSPANEYIVYTLDKAIEIMIVHEQRHFHQACDVLLAIKK
jgi:hypothetical protein